MTDTVDQPPVRHDPSREVPSGYDVFCEGCGYSLVGLADDRCPECGAAYDPAALPFARVPWLCRRRIGAVRAYLATVWMILSSPRRFARELCRPVRVSVADARRFRTVSIGVSTVSFLLAVMGIALADGVMFAGPAERVAMRLVALAAYGLSGWFFFSLATNVPLVIWKAPPAFPVYKLAPVHLYASAPLGLMPLVTVVSVAAAVVGRLAATGGNADDWGLAAFAAGFGCVLLTLLVSFLVLFRVTSASARGWRIIALALYLPVQWAVAALIAALAAIALTFGAATVMYLL